MASSAEAQQSWTPAGAGVSNLRPSGNLPLFPAREELAGGMTMHCLMPAAASWAAPRRSAPAPRPRPGPARQPRARGGDLPRFLAREKLAAAMMMYCLMPAA
jgi:hypothetical protein